MIHHQMKEPHFTGLFQRRSDGKLFTLRELFSEENHQQRNQGKNMNLEKTAGIAGLEEVDRRTLLGRKPETDWSWLKIERKQVVTGVIILLVCVAIMVTWFQTWVKHNDKVLDQSANQVHHQRVIILQPE